MKRDHGDEAPVLKNLQKMKADQENLPPEERARIRQEMRIMIREMKDRLGDRMIVNPTGQRAALRALGDHLDRERAKSEEHPEDLDC
jgi:acyl-CoA reductase-like NAD-dependent aldehyde dehydrogenase